MFTPLENMCGITGIFAFNMVGQVSMINLGKATKSLASRGPDFQNTFNNSTFGLGHRRLSILDPRPEGHQPMSDPSGNYVLVYNGEVYNFKELKQPLENKGYLFHSESDTEVLLYHLIENGSDGISQLNGFFSFAFLNIAKEELLLAIDHAGIKPLYYRLDQDKFIFSSEMKSLLHYGLEKHIDVNSLTAYFQLNYIPGPNTILQGVNKLMPGHYIKINRSVYENKKWYYQEHNQEGKENTTYENAVSTFRKLMERSVEKRLISDVPIGTFLSGGIDSSIISLTAKNLKPDIESFSIGFDKSFFDETNYAKEVAKKIDIKHHVFEFNYQKFDDILFDVLDYIDEPFADSSAIAYYLLSSETRKYSTVSLSGDGADELFGGYNKHLALMKSMEKGFVNSTLGAISPLLSLLPGGRHGGTFNKFRQLKKYGRGVNLSPKERYWNWAGFQSEKQVAKLLDPEFYSNFNTEEYKKLKELYLGTLSTESVDLNHFLKTDTQLVLPWDMLTKVDRMSMANSLEVRVPFLDKDIINFAFGLPTEYKISGKDRKRILYDAYRKDLPEILYQRPKKGFEVPLLEWLRKSMKTERLSSLFDPEFVAEQAIFSPKGVKKLKKAVYSANPGDIHATAWAYIVFQWWYKRYFDPHS